MFGLVRGPLFQMHDPGKWHCETPGTAPGHRPGAGELAWPKGRQARGAKSRPGKRTHQGAPAFPFRPHRLHRRKKRFPGSGHRHLAAILPRRHKRRGLPHRPLRSGHERPGAKRHGPGAPAGAPRHSQPGHGVLPFQQRGPGRGASAHGPRAGAGAGGGLGRAPRKRHRGLFLPG